MSADYLTLSRHIIQLIPTSDRLALARAILFLLPRHQGGSLIDTIIQTELIQALQPEGRLLLLLELESILQDKTAEQKAKLTSLLSGETSLTYFTRLNLNPETAEKLTDLLISLSPEYRYAYVRQHENVIKTTPEFVKISTKLAVNDIAEFTYRTLYRLPLLDTSLKTFSKEFINAFTLFHSPTPGLFREIGNGLHRIAKQELTRYAVNIAEEKEIVKQPIFDFFVPFLSKTKKQTAATALQNLFDPNNIDVLNQLRKNHIALRQGRLNSIFNIMSFAANLKKHALEMEASPNPACVIM